MKNVIITKEEAIKIGYKNYGMTSGKMNADTGLMTTIHFCCEIVFNKHFNREKEFIII